MTETFSKRPGLRTESLCLFPWPG